MSASDAILITGDWISEHYFTTDATKQSFRAQVLARRKEWEAAKDDGTVRTRFAAQRSSLLTRFAAMHDNDASDELFREIVQILGYDGIGYVSEVCGPVTTVRQVSLPEGPSLAIVAAKPVEVVDALLEKDDVTLTTPYVVDDSTQIESVSRLLSALFVADDAPDFALVIAGRVVVLTERERWPEGRFLSFDVQLICERNDDKRGGETDVLLTCLSAESLAPDAEGNIWWRGVFEESIKHTVGVSEELREGVRLSIEIIANDVVRRRATAGLVPLPASEAQVLAKQSLRFLYRILFMLYAEASPELGVLPTGATEYERGYSLDRLRDLIQTPLATPQAEAGTHLYESLAVLFRLVDRGYEPAASSEDEGLLEPLTFRSLRADLFRPEATALIDEVKLSNVEVQRVLQNLLLSKEKRGSDRGFISYAELGINQLGAVYEGLMSYTGRFAENDLYEVAKGGDGSKGTWLVPVDRASSIHEKDFVRHEDPITGERKPVLHSKGGFVFRLAGRERQQSASYYTPEVLTRFTVSQALEELLDQDGATTSAADILKMTVCEPALGSGAFAIEAVRQLAAHYLSRRQDELGERIDPEDFPKELQKVKAFLALHNVYGVDLNSTAVELAEISLWLDTMMAGLQAPWFGLHLRRGNSLIGARRAVYTRLQVEKRSWLKDTPRDVPVSEMVDDVRHERAGSISGQIHHFLLPAEGWGSAVNAKEGKTLAPEALNRLKTWRKSVLVKPTKAQLDALISLGQRVEALWHIAWRRLTIAESEIRRSIDVWGADNLPAGGAVTREQIETSLADPNSAYQRLRRVMDAWCAMWFWPLTAETEPPSLDQWIATLQGLVGLTGKKPKTATSQLSMATALTWDDLGVAEEADLMFAGARPVHALIDEFPWLAAADRVASQQGFFHWELDFAPVFADGGFDLQVGNPPWVRPRSDVEALLAEGDPWWQLKAKSTAAEDKAHREFALTAPGVERLVLDGTSDVASIAAFVGSPTLYPHLAGLQPDLYRCFMEQTWRNAKSTGYAALISLESHFTDEKAGRLRAATYRRLRRHWQFINELILFEIEDHKRYGISVYGSPREPDFLQAASLYHPSTVDRSLKHDGSGVEPGIKDPDGNWDVRPHASRIVRVTPETLASWHAFLETDRIPISETRMVYAVNKSTERVVAKLAKSSRVGELGLLFSRGWDESIDRKKGRFDSEWGVPESWDQVILQGPHIHVATPFFKTPNPTMLNNQDWTATDFEDLRADAIPVTCYKPRGSAREYETSYLRWVVDGKDRSARHFYRLAWRNMAANTGERTLIAALIPPGPAHVDGVYSASIPEDTRKLVCLAGTFGSLIADFAVRVSPKSNIRSGVALRLPHQIAPGLETAVLLRVLRLQCVTDAYAPLWDALFTPDFKIQTWTGGVNYAGRGAIGAVESQWGEQTPLRRAADRRQALLELDVLIAMSLGISVEELCTIYRTQFPVLAGYDDRSTFFDASGRVVPNDVLTLWRKRGGNAGQYAKDEFSVTHPGSGVEYRYRVPFDILDREEGFHSAYRAFLQLPPNREANSV